MKEPKKGDTEIVVEGDVYFEDMVTHTQEVFEIGCSIHHSQGGYDPDCRSCWKELDNTLKHIRQRGLS